MTRNNRLSDDSTLISTRRTTLRVAGGSIIGSILAATPTTAQTSGLSTELTGTVIHKSTDEDDIPISRGSLDINIREPISIGSDREVAVQVRNEDTNQTVLIIPDEVYNNVEKVSLQNVVGHDRQLRPEDDNLSLTVNGEFMTEIPFSVQGDRDTFESGGVFSTFSVAIIEGFEDPTVLAETGETIRGIGWRHSRINQTGRSGEIEISFELIDQLDQSWYAEFKIMDNDFNTVVGPISLQNTGDMLTGTVDLSEADPGTYELSGQQDSQGGWELSVYPSESQTDLGNKIIGSFGIGNDDAIRVSGTDGSTGDDQEEDTFEEANTSGEITEDATNYTEEPTSEADEDTVVTIPGFGVPSAIASLSGAGYLLKRRLNDTELED